MKIGNNNIVLGVWRGGEGGSHDNMRCEISKFFKIFCSRLYVHCVTETKTETIFIPNIKLHKNTSKNNTFFITMSFFMVLIS